MLIDTHCHIQNIIKKEFDVLLAPSELPSAQTIIEQAHANQVDIIINVGTSLIESKNCILLAQHFKNIYASVGIHPNDCTAQWRGDLKELTRLVKQKELHNIVAIGECGLDMHYPDYNLQRQKDAFKAQIELALENDLALIVHTRDAGDETLRALEEFKNQITRGVIHCFSEGADFAQTVIEWGFVLGIGGTITYPKNHVLREIILNLNLQHIVLETDAPFLPIQAMRGKTNYPAHIKDIAEYIAQLKQISFDDVAQHTTENAKKLFKLQ